MTEDPQIAQFPSSFSQKGNNRKTFGPHLNVIWNTLESPSYSSTLFLKTDLPGYGIKVDKVSLGIQNHNDFHVIFPKKTF